MTGKNVCKASVSLIISRSGWCEQSESWPPVVVSGPEEMDDEQARGGPAGKRLIDLVYDGLRVVGTLVEEDERKIIRVTIFEESAQAHPSADTGGQPTLK